MNANSSVLFGPNSGYTSPFLLLRHILGEPEFRMYEKEKVDKKTGRVKRRKIANPNNSSRELHYVFLEGLRRALIRGGEALKLLRILPSATAFKKESYPIKNAKKHLGNEHFYITDIKNAYGSVDLELLAVLLVYVFKFETYGHQFTSTAILHSDTMEALLKKDKLFSEMHAFLKFYFSGERGRGLIFGCVASPYLFNLYMEAFLDSQLRFLFRKRDFNAKITYTRFADDLVFSSRVYIGPDLRRKIREKIVFIGMEVHHRKSKVLARSMGTVFITKVGLHREEPKIVFPGDKRASLHNILHQYFQGKVSSFAHCKTKDPTNVVGGYVAEFLGYVAENPQPTNADKKLLMLCKRFEALAGNRKNLVKNHHP